MQDIIPRSGFSGSGIEQRHDARRVTFERLMCVEIADEIADRSASYINNIRSGGGFIHDE